MVALVLAAAAALPAPARLPTVARLTQRAQPVYCAGARGRAFALTFDDGPSPYTFRLVRTLRALHARATFFDVGSRVGLWPAAARASATVGEIGNHTWSHAHLPGLSSRDARREIVWAQNEITRVVHRAPRLFRAPYAQARPADERLLRELQLLDVRWSVDSGDSRGIAPAAVARAAIAGIRPGAIVLLHDPHPWTARVAAAVIRAAARRGLVSVGVSELLGRQPPTGRQLRSVGTGRCPR